jgi:quinol monooxygenase YgiN
MADHITVFAQFHAAPGKADQLRELLLGLVEPTTAEPGCLHYMVHEELAKPGSFYFYEIFEDATALKAHAESEHVRAAFAAAAPLLAEPVSVTPAKFIAGK